MSIMLERESRVSTGGKGPKFAVLHTMRIVSHEATIWERNLLAGAGPPADVDYGEFTASAILRGAVYEHELVGDTYFTQFRGLHQIPELIAAEVNERLECTIRAMRAPAPRMTCKTSFSVTMVVSPGVVIAKAPCAAPQSTAHCEPCPVKKP